MYEWIEMIDREILIDMLGDLMSNVSEECYSAGWYAGSEYLIPALCEKALKIGTPRRWACGEVTPENASLLVAIFEQIGSWVNLDEGGSRYIAFDPYPIPEKYMEEIQFWKEKRNEKHNK